MLVFIFSYRCAISTYNFEFFKVKSIQVIAISHTHTFAVRQNVIKLNMQTILNYNNVVDYSHSLWPST